MERILSSRAFLLAFLFALVAGLSASGGAAGQAGGGFDLTWNVAGGGGTGPLTGDGFSLRSTLGQTTIGSSSQGNGDLGHGYWYGAALVALESVTISGPTSGSVNTAYAFTAAVSPSQASEPIDYTWSPAPDSGQGTASATYTWNTGGSKSLNVTAQNAGGSAMDSHDIDIIVAVTGVTISGPTEGKVNTAYTFSASVSPADASGPINYTWSPAPDSGQGTASATYSWASEGGKTIDVSAANTGGNAADSHQIEISTHLVYLPTVQRNLSGSAALCSADNGWCEPNNTTDEAYGPLSPAQTYSAHPNDAEDYYYFDLSTTRNVTIVMQDYQATGDLLLYERDNGNFVLIDQWGQSGTAMTIGPRSLSAGRYYVRVFTASGFNTNFLYNLTVTVN